MEASRKVFSAMLLMVLLLAATGTFDCSYGLGFQVRVQYHF
jgi:hypothetical protein